MTIDHSTSKGYPYDIIISRDRFKYRMDPLIDKKTGKILIRPAAEAYPGFTGFTWLNRLFAGWQIDFLMFRIFDYAEALTVAENQIEHLLEEQPFLPEDFGFIKSVGPKEVTDNPTKIYISIYDESLSIFRNMNEDFEWHLIKNEGGAFKDTKLQIPNHRIAYALFFALGIKVEEIKEKELSPELRGDVKPYDVLYTENNDVPVHHKIMVKAINDKDAIEKGKYILENGGFGLTDISADKITVKEI